MQVERLHTIDNIIIGSVILSQLAIAWLLLRHRSPHKVILAALCPIWIAVGYGIWLSSVSNSRYQPPGPGWLHAIGTGSEIMWGFVSTLGVAVFLIRNWLLRRTRGTHSAGRRAVIKGSAIAAIAGPAAVIGYGALIERTSYRVREIDLPIRNLHPDMQGMRIAQLSDLHVSPFLSVSEAARVVAMTNELKPHLTLFTGDLITEIGDPLDAALAELAKLRADLGVIGCMGNHEAYARCQSYLTAEAAKVGIPFLRHRAMEVRRGAGVLNIGGVDFQSSTMRRYYLFGAQSLLKPDMPNLLLSHNPDVFPAAARQGWDAVLAGHTHGGQVTVEIFEQSMNLARFYTPFVAGLYRIGARSCYVTRGIGTIGMPVRFGETPEITLLKLVRA